MPILPAESECYPPDLWSAPDRLHADGRWWCLHTKPRQEKATARALTSRRVTHYLPQLRQTRRTPAGRASKSTIPLFPSYLFLHGDEPARLAALGTQRLVKAIWVEDQDLLTRDLKQIHQVLSSGLPVRREPVHPVGSWVRIKDGALCGLSGIVERRGKQDRFTAVVRFIGQGASVELQDWQVEPISPPTPSREPH